MLLSCAIVILTLSQSIWADSIIFRLQESSTRMHRRRQWLHPGLEFPTTNQCAHPTPTPVSTTGSSLSLISSSTASSSVQTIPSSSSSAVLVEPTTSNTPTTTTHGGNEDPASKSLYTSPPSSSSSTYPPDTVISSSFTSNISIPTSITISESTPSPPPSTTPVATSSSQNPGTMAATVGGAIAGIAVFTIFVLYVWASVVGRRRRRREEAGKRDSFSEIDKLRVMAMNPGNGIGTGIGTIASFESPVDDDNSHKPEWI